MAPALDAAPAPGQEIHLRQSWQVLVRNRRLVLGVFLAAVAAGSLWALQGRPMYRATTQMILDREDPVVVSFKTVTDVNERGWSDEFFQTQSKMVASRSVLLGAIRDMDLLQSPEFGGPRPAAEVATALAAPPGQSRLIEATVTTLLGRTDVDWLRGTRLVNVSYEASDPARAAAIADGIARSFISRVREARQGASTEATTWLAGAIEAQRAKVAAAERALQSQRDQEQLIEGIVSVDDRRTLVEQRLKELATARNVARTRRLEREALFREMKATANPLELPDVLRNPVITQMRVEQGNLERRLAMLDEKYLGQHPEVVRLRNQLDETRRKIDEEARQVVRAAENDARAALAQESSLDQALDAAKAEFESLSRRTVTYDAARRDLDAAKAVLAGLTGRMKETDVAQGLSAVYVRISEPASPPRQAAGPRRLLKFLCGLVAGLLGGIGLALFKDGLDDTVRTPDDVRAILDLPLLSVVPVAAGAGGGLLLGRPGSEDLVEPTRLLRAHVEQAVNGSGRGHVILLTSTVPGEGKTLTSANLALSLARGGQRVLLVDADLRQAAASRLLGCAPGPGLAEVLAAGSGALARVRPVAGLGLDVLPAGGPGFEDRCAARALEPLLAELRSAYDWVVVDAPPVGAVADALVLAPLADGTLLVVQAERVPRPAAQLTAERLARSGGRLLGVVLNRAPVERYPYEYGFHYGRYGRGPALLPAAPAPERADAAHP